MKTFGNWEVDSNGITFLPNEYWVDSDDIDELNYEGNYDWFEHLAGKYWFQEGNNSNDFLNAWRQVMKDNNIPVDEEIYNRSVKEMKTIISYG